MESAKPAVVETLLGYGAEVHVCGGRLRETPLHIAARVKDGDRCALMLLKSGAHPNQATEDGQTPVHVAAKHGNLTTLQFLLEDGGDALRRSLVSSNRLQFHSLIRLTSTSLPERRNPVALGLSQLFPGDRGAFDSERERTPRCRNGVQLHKRGKR